VEWEPSQQIAPCDVSFTPQTSPEVRKAVRDLLRHGGHKPSGRGRPASESLLKAQEDGRFPCIHPVVDFFNRVSLESGLPISVLDADKLCGETSFRLGRDRESYVFNPSGQELRLNGLLLLCDEDGPTGSPVKDAQRTKVDDQTNRFYVVVWGTSELPETVQAAHTRIGEWAAERGLNLSKTT
jgi:DNA/RNA-binding domain of Phe-tRNA-synthetase-like protein